MAGNRRVGADGAQKQTPAEQEASFIHTVQLIFKSPLENLSSRFIGAMGRVALGKWFFFFFPIICGKSLQWPLSFVPQHTEAQFLGRARIHLAEPPKPDPNPNQNKKRGVMSLDLLHDAVPRRNASSLFLFLLLCDLRLTAVYLLWHPMD